MNLLTYQPINRITEKTIFRFRNFPVYKEVRKFRTELKLFSKQKFPQSERFALTDQLWRALDSIILNIAEGSRKYSDIEFSKFLNNSSTSLDECVACLDGALDDNYISEKEHTYWLLRADSLSRQLSAFSSKVRNDAKRR